MGICRRGQSGSTVQGYDTIFRGELQGETGIFGKLPRAFLQPGVLGQTHGHAVVPCRRIQCVFQILRANPCPAGISQPLGHGYGKAPALQRRGQRQAIGQFAQGDGIAKARKTSGSDLQIGYAVGRPRIPFVPDGGEELFGQLGGCGESGKGLRHGNEYRRQMLHNCV